MKQNRFNSTLKVAAMLSITGVALMSAVSNASAQSQQTTQIALQLGAIQLGYTNSSWMTNPQQLANAWVQGTNALNATTTNKYAGYVVSGTNPAATNAPAAQTGNFRAQLYTATLKALGTPIRYTNTISPVNVVVKNGNNNLLTTNTISSFGFDPTLITTAQVLTVTTARVPNFGPGLVSNAVAASMLYTTNQYGYIIPVYGPQPFITNLNNPVLVSQVNQTTAAKQLSNAAAAANAALIASAKAYLSGTTNWAPAPVSGPTNTNYYSLYLPNYSTSIIGPTNNYQKPDLIGLANAAAAVSANAINGLGAINTNSSALYGKTASNVQSMTASLIAAAATYQTVSNQGVTNARVYNNGKTYFGIGSVGASAVGIVTQVSGNANDNWGSYGTPGVSAILNGVVSGAVSALGTNYSVGVVNGVSIGFYATYLATYSLVSHPTNSVPDNLATFESKNATNLATSFYYAYTLAGYTNLTLSTLISNVNRGFLTVYQAATGTNSSNGVIANLTNCASWDQYDYMLPGGRALHIGQGNVGTTNTNIVSALFNGVGTPVTDTTGL